MDIHKRARRAVIATLCACSAVAGIGMAAAPGSALAVACTKITGSGSSLQAEQQSQWEKTVNPKAFTLGSCAAFEPKVTYTATSSGKGLTEFGIQENKATSKFELTPSEAGNGKSELDGFVGTDDAPTLTALAETEPVASKKAGTRAWTTPIVAAPVAVIFHMPTGCEVPGTTSEFKLPWLTLEEVFLGQLTWWQFLLLLFTESEITQTGTDCEVPMTLEVRSDSSGTSFAFKQFLCQAEPAGWGGSASSPCESGEDFVTDAESWPATVSTEHEEGSPLKKVLNEGSKGEANAVKETPGSVGYVNLANAVAAGFLPFLESKTLFWARVEGETSSEFAEPLKTGTTEANCPTTYTFPAGVEAEAKEGMWAKVHLAKVGQSGAYSICTFTYDIGWENYKTTELEKEYKNLGTEVGNTASAYFKYMVGKTEGQKNIAPYYAPLPTNVDTIAEEIAMKIG